MSEATIVSGLQSLFQAMAEFENADVVVNDWSILDKPNDAAPYILIETSDEFDARQDTMTANTRWSIPVNLIVRFVDWKTSMDAMRTNRQAMIDAVNSGTGRSAGLDGVTIDRIYSDGGISEIKDRSTIHQDRFNDALPIFLAQRIIFEAEEF